jgi:hypothetical protein
VASVSKAKSPVPTVSPVTGSVAGTTRRVRGVPPMAVFPGRRVISSYVASSKAFRNSGVSFFDSKNADRSAFFEKTVTSGSIPWMPRV